MGEFIFDQSPNRDQRSFSGPRGWKMPHEIIGNNFRGKAWKAELWKNESS